jgi:hypothetical protein
MIHGGDAFKRAWAFIANEEPEKAHHLMAESSISANILGMFQYFCDLTTTITAYPLRFNDKAPLRTKTTGNRNAFGNLYSL